MASKPELLEKLVRMLDTAGHRIAARAVVATKKPELAAQLKTWIDDPAIELVVGPLGSTMRAALLPLITKRLAGFTDLRDIDGGRCESTIVVLVPAETVSFETIDAIESRLLREARRSGATLPPPVHDQSGIVERRAPSTPPPFRNPRGSKTKPPPLPVPTTPPDDEPDFIIRHRRPPDAEFEETLKGIKPARLEPVPLVVRPIPPRPPSRKRPILIAIAAATVAGALVGRVLAWREHAAEAPVAAKPTDSEPVAMPAPPPPAPHEVAPPRDPIELPPAPVEGSADDAGSGSDVPSAGSGADVPSAGSGSDVPSAAQLWSKRPRCSELFCEFDDYIHPCCQVYKRDR